MSWATGADDPGTGVMTAPDAAQTKAIARRFPGRWLQGYVRGKLGSDPAYAAAAHEIDSTGAPVLDVGCGIGLLCHYLHAVGCDAEYLGIDLDAHKVKIAQHAAAGIDHARFATASCETLPAWQGTVVMLDILHYLTADLQQAVLRTAAARIGAGASLIIRSVIRDDSWRFGITRLEEAFMRSVRWMRYGVQHYPDFNELETPLKSAGLTLRIQPLWGRTPFNSYLLIARRSL